MRRHVDFTLRNPLPLDKSTADYVELRAMTDPDLTRRRFLGRAASLTLMSSSLLSACGGVEGTARKTPTAAPTVEHPKRALTEIHFSNWPLYIEKKVIRNF